MFAVAAAEVPRASTVNLHASARHLIGQRAGGWLNTLKDVKDKVQSVAPSLPKLLPNTILDASVVNGAKRQYSVNNLPPDLCKNLATRDRQKELQKENNDCESDRPADTVSAQLPVSISISSGNGNLCHTSATSDSAELAGELSSKLCVDNLSVPSDACDQNSVASAMQYDNQSNIFGENHDHFCAADNTDCVQHTSSSQTTSSYEGEENLPSSQRELQQHPKMEPQSTILNPPTDVRTFSAYVEDCPEIIFASTRKRTKPTKRGIDNSSIFICTQDSVLCSVVFTVAAVSELMYYAATALIQLTSRYMPG